MPSSLCHSAPTYRPRSPRSFAPLLETNVRAARSMTTMAASYGPHRMASAVPRLRRRARDSTVPAAVRSAG